jgi:putative nucleotidyltransferase with HDIG domain
MQKKNNLSGLFNGITIPSVRTGPAVATLTAFVITAIVNLAINGKASFDINDFEIGMVADRDIIAHESLSFTDNEATSNKIKEEIKQIPAVWKYDVSKSDETRKVFDHFYAFSKVQFAQRYSEEEYIRNVNEAFPAFFTRQALSALYRDSGRDNSLAAAEKQLDYFLGKGIFAIPKKIEGSELAFYNPDIGELLHNYSDRTGRERVLYEQLITMDNLDALLSRFIDEEKLSRDFSAGAGTIVKSILRENVFFSETDSSQRVEEVISRLEPVNRVIQRGDKVIRRGFIITESEMEDLNELKLLLTTRDPRLIAGNMLLLLAIFIFLVFHMGKRTVGRILRPAECYMMTVLAAGYLIGAMFAGNFADTGNNFPLSILIPTPLAVMLPGILLGFPAAMVTAMALPLGAFLCEAFEPSAYFFALCSGLVAVHVLKSAQKRIDMVKAGLIIAAANAGAALIILLLRQAPAVDYVRIIFWAAFNGLISSLLFIGILPLMEQALNAVTPFRLIELSDLNSPMLKRLFNTAPGTYNHSLMVANLAETACHEIGANALLARVGAYYHDIGKMEQPAYFVENQTSYNKHTDISPRLSATVIRSHVKLGMEKAYALGLPEAVIAFIAEHHGNSVITWFYNEALKKEGSVNMEDFMYPGRPPRSKESAVVMLADITEAATRVLKKPTTARLEKFIQELFDGKVDHGQLSQSDLTFRELEIIKQAFIKVLISYYHTRIEYPKIHEQN